MSLQKRIIDRYRLFYPEETLREISARTGIQITRVFRLFNGKAMKIGEFEAFESAIQLKIAETPHYSRLSELVEEALSVLSSNEVSKIADLIERKIQNKKIGKNYIQTNYEETNIA